MEIRENLFLKKRQLAAISKKLVEEIDRLEKNGKPTKRELSKDDMSDPCDEANANIQASHELRMDNRKVFYLKKLKEAQVRVTDGSYGQCKECDCEVGYERLLARPTADLCINCKEEAELQEKNNVFGRRSKSLGKTMQEVVSR